MMPKLIMIKLAESSRRRITVVKPSTATPMVFCTSEMALNIALTMSMTTPSTVVMCSGAEEKEPIR